MLRKRLPLRKDVVHVVACHGTESATYVDVSVAGIATSVSQVSTCVVESSVVLALRRWAIGIVLPREYVERVVAHDDVAHEQGDDRRGCRT